jgi:hypothetical protein
MPASAIIVTLKTIFSQPQFSGNLEKWEECSQSSAYESEMAQPIRVKGENSVCVCMTN